ncbi:DsbA family protein [Streptomyces sp. enrichment culture]|uniref:DsbA family protein n=1 Tax=Streptomyces sp. enrichment culture TaxID=1795815 RepID=UPI003F5457C1
MIAAMVAVLATGCGGQDAGTGDERAAQADAYASVEEIAEAIGPDGTTIIVGSPTAGTTVHLYEDMRCPACEQFETQGSGETLRNMVMTGEVKVEYTLASFLDGKLGGQGSRKAANALRAAVDEGRFVEYHEVLYANQPEESVDGYTETFLLDMASKVDGLRGPEFDAAVKGMTHRDWVDGSQRAFDLSGVGSTPTMKVNGKVVDGIFDAPRLPLLILSQ